VLLDIMLPVMDGWGVCRRSAPPIKSPHHHAHCQGRDLWTRVNGLEMGADDYIVKPFEVKELIARIHAVMRRYDARRMKSHGGSPSTSW
jgi:DNA-binding response OmpR family regulator